MCCSDLQNEGVKCTSTQAQTVTCQVGYPALLKDEEVSARSKHPPYLSDFSKRNIIPCLNN